MTKLGLPVIRDLSRKLGDRVNDEMLRTAMLADDPNERFMISLGALTQSVAVAGALFSAIDGKYQDPYELAIVLLREIRDKAPQEVRAAIKARMEKEA